MYFFSSVTSFTKKPSPKSWPHPVSFDILSSSKYHLISSGKDEISNDPFLFLQIHIARIRRIIRAIPPPTEPPITAFNGNGAS